MMSDKERAEKLLITLIYLGDCLRCFTKMIKRDPGETLKSIEETEKTIQLVVDKNLRYINLDELE
jgi:hypothetical protein